MNSSKDTKHSNSGSYVIFRPHLHKNDIQGLNIDFDIILLYVIPERRNTRSTIDIRKEYAM